jgi:hypothetical protein
MRLSEIVFTTTLTSLLLAFIPQPAHASATTDGLDALTRAAGVLARHASGSQDRKVRKQLAPVATEVEEDLAALAERAHKGLPARTVASELAHLALAAAPLEDLCDEAADRDERRVLRAQARAVIDGIAQLRARLREAREPRAAARPAAMGEDAFHRLLVALESASFESERLDIVRAAAQRNWFTAEQIVSVMATFDFSSGKVDSAAAMWPHLVDPENAFVVVSALDSDSDKAELRRRVGG